MRQQLPGADHDPWRRRDHGPREVADEVSEDLLGDVSPLVRQRLRAAFVLAPALVAVAVVLAAALGPLTTGERVVVTVVTLVVCGMHAVAVDTALRATSAGRRVGVRDVVVGVVPVLLAAVTGWLVLLLGDADDVERWWLLGSWALVAGVALSAWLLTRTTGFVRTTRDVLVGVTGSSGLALVLFPDATVGDVGPTLGGEGLTATVLLELAVLVVGVAVPVLAQRSMWWWWRTLLDLQAERRTIARRASAAGRARVAGELHDLQGHSMQVIALEAELAQRLIATAPEEAAGHLQVVREAASSTMDLTRSLARGHRTLTLDAEVASAAQLLRSAAVDVDAVVDRAGRALPGAVEDLVASTVLEAVTNVLRHSQALHAELVVRVVEDPGGAGDGARLVLRCSNDGLLGGPRGRGGAAGALAGVSGVEGLAARWIADGGSLVAGVEDGRWVLAGTLPLARGQVNVQPSRAGSGAVVHYDLEPGGREPLAPVVPPDAPGAGASEER